MKRVRLRRGRNGTGNGNGTKEPKEPYFIPLGQNAECNAELLAQMIYYIERLIPERDACHLTGLFENTHWKWKRNGRDYLAAHEEEWEKKPNKKHKVYAQYTMAINRAIAKSRQRIIERSLEPDSLVPTWVRDMTILERRDRDNWSRHNEPLLDRSEDFDPDESFL